MRLKLYRQRYQDERHRKAAVRIQSWWRRSHYCRWYSRWLLPKYRRILRGFQRLGKQRLPRLRLGHEVKKIQKAYRLYCFRNHRYLAAVKILGFYRFQQWKQQKKQNHLAYQANCARLIQSFLKANLYRKAMDLRRKRQHMAAFKIYVSTLCSILLLPIVRAFFLDCSYASISYSRYNEHNAVSERKNGWRDCRY